MLLFFNSRFNWIIKRFVSIISGVTSFTLILIVQATYEFLNSILYLLYNSLKCAPFSSLDFVDRK